MGDLSSARLYVLALILVHTVGHFAYMGIWRHLTAPDFDVNDFKAYYTAALAVRTGQADQYLYSDPDRINLGVLPDQPWVRFAVGHGVPHPSAYIYPPFFAVVLAPITLAPYHAANLAWFALNTTLLAASVLMLAGLARGPGAGRDRPLDPVAAAAVVFACLNFFPTIRALQCGQAGFVLLFLTVAALRALSGGRDRTAGICLALATAIKLTPIVLVFYLLWAGRRRAAAWAAGALGIFAAVSVLAAGWGNHVLYVSGFLPSLSRGAATYANQSINGLLNRLLTDQSMAVFDFSEEPLSVRLLARACAILLMGAAFLLARPAARGRAAGPAGPASRRRFDLGYGLVVLTSLLVSPISWEHHYVLALLPLALMIGEAARTGSIATIGGLAIAYVAMSLDIFELVRKQLPFGSRLAISYVLAGGVLLWILTARAVAHRAEGA